MIHGVFDVPNFRRQASVMPRNGSTGSAAMRPRFLRQGCVTTPRVLVEVTCSKVVIEAEQLEPVAATHPSAHADVRALTSTVI
jgi:hypothetical protein